MEEKGEEVAFGLKQQYALVKLRPERVALTPCESSVFVNADPDSSVVGDLRWTNCFQMV